MLEKDGSLPPARGLARIILKIKNLASVYRTNPGGMDLGAQ